MMNNTRIPRLLYEETTGLIPRWMLAKLLLAPFPPYVGGRTRAVVLRAMGFHIGKGCIFWGMPTFMGGRGMHKRLTIGDGSRFNVGCLFDICAPIHIGKGAAFGIDVLLTTSKHDVADHQHRAGHLIPTPIEIGDGVWVGSRAVILPGVTIGPGAVVAAGSVVSRSIPADCMVAGIPARIIRHMERETDRPMRKEEEIKSAEIMAGSSN